MKTVHILSTILALTVITGRGAVLVSYDIAGETVPEIVAPTFVDENISASDLTPNRVTLSLGAGEQLVAQLSSGFYSQSTLSVDTTLTNANYFSFTVTPDAGQMISLTNLTLQGRAGGATTPRAFYVFSSASGFSSPDLLLSATTGGGGLTTTLADYTVPLSSPEFQNLTGSVEFRIYVQLPSGTSGVNFDNIVLNGTVTAVPEPAALTLIIATGCFGFALTRKRR